MQILAVIAIIAGVFFLLSSIQLLRGKGRQLTRNGHLVYLAYGVILTILSIFILFNSLYLIFRVIIPLIIVLLFSRDKRIWAYFGEGPYAMAYDRYWWEKSQGNDNPTSPWIESNLTQTSDSKRNEQFSLRQFINSLDYTQTVMRIMIAYFLVLGIAGIAVGSPILWINLSGPVSQPPEFTFSFIVVIGSILSFLHGLPSDAVGWFISKPEYSGPALQTYQFIGLMLLTWGIIHLGLAWLSSRRRSRMIIVRMMILWLAYAAFNTYFFTSQVPRALRSYADLQQVAAYFSQLNLIALIILFAPALIILALLTNDRRIVAYFEEDFDVESYAST